LLERKYNKIKKKGVNVMKNPASLLYMRPTMPSIVISKRWQKYHNLHMKNLLEGTLTIGHMYAVSSSDLSASVKSKKEDRRLAIGKKIFYILFYEELAPNKKKYFSNHADTRIYESEEFDVC
jgi:hypothetical protein